MKILREWMLPILVLCNFIMFLKEYIGTGNVNFTLLCIIFALTPIAFKNKIELLNNNYTYFSVLMFVLAASMLILQSIKTM